MNMLRLVAGLILLAALPGVATSNSIMKTEEPMMDHIILAVPDVAAAKQELKHALGVDAEFGGKHPGLGTENALLSLGGRQYLEILGPQADIEQPVGLGEVFANWEASDIPAFAVAAADLNRIKVQAEEAGIQTTDISDGSRRTRDGTLLQWRGMFLISEIYKGLVPFYIDWGDTPHPGETSPQGAILKNMVVTHPQPEGLRAIYHELGIDIEVQYSNRAGIIIEIEGISDDIILHGSGGGLGLE